MGLCTRVEMYEFGGQACASASLPGSVAFVMMVIGLMKILYSETTSTLKQNECLLKVMENCDAPPIRLSADR